MIPIHESYSRTKSATFAYALIFSFLFSSFPIYLFFIQVAGNDIQAQAKTGSGKTLAFLIPAIELAILNVCFIIFSLNLLLIITFRKIQKMFK